MNILIAPNSMKGSLDCRAVAEAVAAGFRQASPVFNLRLVPLADGGDFTGPLLREALGAREFREVVADPLGRPVEAVYGIAGVTAVIEMAEASGLRLLSEEERHPAAATSFGTGQLIRAALDRGCRKILLGLGGSASIDGGMGLLAALGFTFHDAAGELLNPLPASLYRVERITPPPGFSAETEFILLADVTNPLLGEQGAAAIFGPQKGATPAMISGLEEGLAHWISLLESQCGKSLRDLPGMGAAGGVAAGLVAYYGAQVVSGADYIFDLVNLDASIGWADWIITGEGRTDSRGGETKAPGRLAARAAASGKPVTALAGSYEEEGTASYAGVFSIGNGPHSLQELMSAAAGRMTSLALQIARVLLYSYPGALLHHSRLSLASQALQNNDPERLLSLLGEGDLDYLAACWYLRGSLFHKLQRWGDAINAYAQCLHLDPGNQKAQAGVAMVQQILSFRNPDLLNP